MALRKHRGRGNAGILATCLLLCGFVLKVPSFVGSKPTGPRHGIERYAGDDEVAALLAQAKALREEAERDEASIKAQRSAQEAVEAAAAVEAATAAADATALKAAAERAQQAAQAAGEDDLVAKARAELAAAKANLEMAKQEASGVRVSTQTVAAPVPGQTGNPTGRLEDVKMNYSGTVMTQAEWEDLSEKFKDMNLIEQFQTNSKVGPQGRRKLKALRDGQTGRAFILPGERVRLLEEDNAFRAAFKRFPAGSLNGYSAEKWAKRGQECIIEKTFNDKTITCVFADGSRLDFPWEIVNGYVDD